MAIWYGLAYWFCMAVWTRLDQWVPPYNRKKWCLKYKNNGRRLALASGEDLAITSDSIRRLDNTLAEYEEILANGGGSDRTVEQEFVIGGATLMKYADVEKVRDMLDLEDDEFSMAMELLEVHHDDLPEIPHFILAAFGIRDGFSETDVARGNVMLEGAMMMLSNSWSCDLSTKATRLSCFDIPEDVLKTLDAVFGLDEAQHEIGFDREGNALA